MNKITAFTFLTINGFYKGLNDDISWHVHGEEGNKYSEDQLAAGNILLFGRKTYEMMNSFWPTQMAFDLYPKVAEGMNNAEKIVLSNSLTKASWQHTKIISDNVIDQIKQLKSTTSKNITILGSGSIVSLLTDAGLIDEYEFLIDPIAIGNGTPIFENINAQLTLKLVSTKVFDKSGQILLTYTSK